jgi:hypothetical protein
VKRFAYLAVALGLCTTGSCAEVKPVVRTAVDIARDLCAMVAAQRQSISIEDAVNAFCATETELEPWIDAVLAAQEQATAKAQAAAKQQAACP